MARGHTYALTGHHVFFLDCADKHIRHAAGVSLLHGALWGTAALACTAGGFGAASRLASEDTRRWLETRIPRRLPITLIPVATFWFVAERQLVHETRRPVRFQPYRMKRAWIEFSCFLFETGLRVRQALQQ